MTAAININAYSDALVVLGTAGVVVPMVRHWGINPVLGYLGAGAILVFIVAIGYYITPELVGGTSGIFISNRIAYHISSSLNWGLGAALGVLLPGPVPGRKRAGAAGPVP